VKAALTVFYRPPLGVKLGLKPFGPGNFSTLFTSKTIITCFTAE